MHTFTTVSPPYLVKWASISIMNSSSENSYFNNMTIHSNETFNSLLVFASNVWKFYPWVYFTLGIPLNAVNIGIMLRRCVMTSHIIYITLLSVVDSMALLHKLISHHFSTFHIVVTPGYCRYIHFTVEFSSHLSIWLLVILTLERAIVVKWPFSRLTILNIKCSLTVVIVVIVVLIGLNCHLLFTVTANVDDQVCTYDPSVFAEIKMYWYVGETALFSLSLAVLIASNTVIVVSLLQRRLPGNLGPSTSAANGSIRRDNRVDIVISERGNSTTSSSKYNSSTDGKHILKGSNSEPLASVNESLLITNTSNYDLCCNGMHVNCFKSDTCMKMFSSIIMLNGFKGMSSSPDLNGFELYELNRDCEKEDLNNEVNISKEHESSISPRNIDSISQLDVANAGKYHELDDYQSRIPLPGVRQYQLVIKDTNDPTTHDIILRNYNQRINNPIQNDKNIDKYHDDMPQELISKQESDEQSKIHSETKQCLLQVPFCNLSTPTSGLKATPFVDVAVKTMDHNLLEEIASPDDESPEELIYFKQGIISNITNEGSSRDILKTSIDCDTKVFKEKKDDTLSLRKKAEQRNSESPKRPNSLSLRFQFQKTTTTILFASAVSFFLITPYCVCAIYAHFSSDAIPSVAFQLFTTVAFALRDLNHVTNFFFYSRNSFVTFLCKLWQKCGKISLPFTQTKLPDEKQV